VRFALAAAACAALGAARAGAEDFPLRPVRVVVPFPAGGSADLLPRILAERLAVRWAQPVIIDNRAGAGGNIGAEAAFKAEPDGYTLLATPPPPLVMNQSLYPRLGFDPARFVPVTIFASIPSVLLVHPRVPADSVPSFFAWARAHPNALNYASQGSGTTSHLTTELMKSLAGLQITHVPYKGSAPALADLLAGQVDLMFDNLGASLPYAKSGRLRALAVGSERRVAALPDVPPMRDFLPGFLSGAWYGIVAPPGTSTEIAARIQEAVSAVLREPEVLRRLADMAAEPAGSSPAEMAAFMKLEVERWRRVIESARIRPD